MFKPSQISNAFPPAEWKKGTRLFKKNLVRYVEQEGNEFYGEVESESDYDLTYEVSVWFDQDIEEFCTECDCFVGYQCKHAAALAHAYLDTHVLNSKAGMTIDHEPQQLMSFEVASWMKSFTTPETPARNLNQPKKALFYYLSHPDNGHNTKSIFKSLNAVSSKQNKNGSWSKVQSLEHISHHLLTDDLVTPTDLTALLPVVKTGGYTPFIKEFHIYEKLVATERFYWRKSDVPDSPITIGNTLTANWRWQEVSSNSYQINLVFDQIDDELQIVVCQPLAYFNQRTKQIGPIQTQLDSELDLKLVNSPVINEQHLPQVLTKLQMFSKKVVNDVPAPENIKILAPTKPIVQLKLFDKPESHYSGMVKVNFQYGDTSISPYEESDTLVTNSGNLFLRDHEIEQHAVSYLKSKLFAPVLPYGYSKLDGQAAYLMGLHGKANWFKFLHLELPKLEAQGWQIHIEDDFPFQLKQSNGTFDAQIDEDSSNDFFSLGLNLDVDGESLPAFPILQSAVEQLPAKVLLAQDKSLYEPTQPIYIELEQGQFIALEHQQVLPFVKQFIELFMPENMNKNGTLKFSYLQSPQTLSFLDDQGLMAKGAIRTRALAEKLKDFTQVSEVPTPQGLKAELRTYQQQGLNWLQFLREYELNGILADDMGLGKTVQTLSHLLIEKEQGRMTSPCLILAPTSVVYNWLNEINKFTPALSAVVINGNKRQKELSQFKKYDIVITSYALINKDLETYLTAKFYYLVLDEAHYIKNPKTKLYTSVNQLKAERKLCLTGTPMENNLSEFWSQFNFLSVGFLGGHKQFTKLFRTPIEKHGDHERKRLLNKRIRPFILRRTKEKIAKDLPAKTEIIQTLKLAGKQAELYESVRLSMDTKISQLISKKGIKRSQIEILDALLKLRQVCNHPQLLPLNIAKKVNQSAKLDFLMDTVPELISEGRKILIFSQFTSMLSLIEETFNKEKIDYLKLTGATRNRQELVDKFQTGDTPVFLISLKAGGVGLNLTAADTVIHFDPWWNPAVENQATDRAHRIGQDKPVFVYKLIVENSIEQTIQTIQKNKAELAEALLSEEASDKKLTLTEDIVNALMAPLS